MPMFVEVSLMVALGGAPSPAAQAQDPPKPVMVQAPTLKPAPAGAGQAAAAKAPVQPPPAPLIGFWESDATSRGGIGTALLIHGDGSCDFTVTLKVEFKYTYDGASGKLVFAADAQGTPETTLGATLNGDTLVVTPPAGAAITKTRAAPAPDAEHPIVGVWRYLHASGGTAWERYLAEGTMQFRLPTSDRPSTCTVTGDRLAITSPQMKTDAKYEVAGAELRLYGAAGEPRLFRRIEGGRWYGKADLPTAK
jgi:hypothetical protein